MTTLAKVLVRIRHRVPIQAGSSTTSGRARHIAPSRATNAGGTSARSGIEQPPERAADPSHQGGGGGGAGGEGGAPASDPPASSATSWGQRAARVRHHEAKASPAARRVAGE